MNNTDIPLIPHLNLQGSYEACNLKMTQPVISVSWYDPWADKESRSLLVQKDTQPVNDSNDQRLMGSVLQVEEVVHD